mgnify:CR=1 FL=1
MAAAPAGDGEVVAFLVRGVGNGHGRGLSQWGTFGRAVNGGQTWQQILDTYYGGTVAGSRTLPDQRVRLTKWDGAAVFVDPGRPAEIARGVNGLIDDAAVRADYQARARERATRFTPVNLAVS